MKLLERLQKKTLRFFRKLRNIGIALAAASAAILAAPIAVPASIISVAGYLAVAGTVANAVSQAVVNGQN